MYTFIKIDFTSLRQRQRVNDLKITMVSMFWNCSGQKKTYAIDWNLIRKFYSIIIAILREDKGYEENQFAAYRQSLDKSQMLET